MNLGLILGLWLGIGGLVVIWANLHLWHIRRVLRTWQDSGLQQDNLIPPVVVEPKRPAMAS
jgi:hypothetical protein